MESFHRIVRERDIVRLMKDWSEHSSSPESLYGFIDWLQTQRRTPSTSVRTNNMQLLSEWCFEVSDIPYSVLTIDCTNAPSCRLAERLGFELFERRTPIGHKQPNMESDSYYYYRMYRKHD